MRHRRRFAIVSVLSLLLCSATVMLWVRSHRVSDVYGFSNHFWVQTDRGELLIVGVGPNANFAAAVGYSRGEPSNPDEPWNYRRVAVHNWNLIAAHGETFPSLTSVVVELWAVVLLLIWPIPFLIGYRIKNKRANVCPICSYNLTANTSGTCPECGTAVPKPPKRGKGERGHSYYGLKHK